MKEHPDPIPIQDPDDNTVAHYVPIQQKGLKYKLTTPFSHRLGSCWAGISGNVPPTGNDPTVYVAVSKGKMNLPACYAWNGANWFPEPTWVRYPSLVHDAECQLLNDGDVYDSGQPVAIGSKVRRRLRKCADQEFRDILRALGRPGWARIIFRVMRIYAFFRGNS